MKYCYIIFLSCLVSCTGSRHYVKSKKGFDNYYFIKQHKDDSLRLLVFTEGIPHYYYTKVYANQSGEISRIIIEKDGDEFYQAVTEIRNEKPYFNDKEIQHISSLELIDLNTFYEKHIKYAVESGHGADLKSQRIIGFIRIAKPKDYIEHLRHKKFLTGNKQGQ